MGRLPSMSTRHVPRADSGAEPTVPPARRLATTRWRDPRLAIGVVLVAGSVVLGSQVLASADDTVPVWSLNSDVSAGTTVPTDAVEVDHVRLDGGGDTALYLPGTEPFPADRVATHDLAAGELVGRSDLQAPLASAGTELPVPVEDGHLPTDLGAGDRVDLWVAAGDGAGRDAQPAERLLVDARVVAVQRRGGGLGGGSGAVVLLGLDEAQAERLPEVLGAMTAGTPVLVRVGG